ncbi:hypothetical protein Y032_0024g1073 [Ancylostoma ceylanicum]|uniref:Uncharacterized protein n=1 Tax=Ancylostoma ceylanicum TaxID=53326 RepID=A0A016UWP1_9BILA|nr:hypothetical protein Y032_0024g1073 [Ancylostoma ceylanicum]
MISSTWLTYNHLVNNSTNEKSNSTSASRGYLATQANFVWFLGRGRSTSLLDDSFSLLGACQNFLELFTFAVNGQVAFFSRSPVGHRDL